jgi:hypothetical protein
VSVWLDAWCESEKAVNPIRNSVIVTANQRFMMISSRIDECFSRQV